MISSLPSHLLNNASVRGKEYAWPLELIPSVIESCKAAGLVSLGGQLQFRLPSGTCECYWVAVDTRTQIDTGREWDDLVSRSASIALRQFETLKSKFNFEEEGRKAFASSFSQLESAGGAPKDHACFVWYARDRDS